ncbi:hypothetical protein ASG54_14760 [Aureimonas sp. Leaf460]|nr:hypothetical protein ASG62_01460 [Aureimonas sp. Leaf427]KQT76042.1 hypothetical protein ASG54_14760 [Aureimonas sp. Leaf460]
MNLEVPFSLRVAAEPAFFSQAPRRIGGVDVISVAADEARRILMARIEAKIFTKVGFLNAHCVNLAFESETYRRSLEDFVILPDGIGIDIASQLLYGTPFCENLNGTDFVPYLLAETGRPLSVALLGAEPGVADEACARLVKACPQHRFAVVSHGYFQEGLQTEVVLSTLRTLKPDIAIVALGVPRQELWIAEHLSGEECTIAIGVGALLDFVAGKVSRAPALVRMMRMEWIWRMMIEPRRLWKRYILGNPTFLARMIALWWRKDRGG